MNKNIAVIYGGDSSEYGISVQSGKHVASVIDNGRYNVYEVLVEGTAWTAYYKNEEINIDKDDFSFRADKKKINFDCVVIMIHGTPGENGILQAYFELLRIPYTTCDVLCSSLTFNKNFCKTYLKDFGINIPKSHYYRKGEVIDPNYIIHSLRLPLFVKPNSGGSSFGITKVKYEQELIPAIQKAYKESDDVIIEEYVEGREITSGLYASRGEIKVLPLCEIVSKKEFFDYEAKYTPSLVDEIVPAPITDLQTKTCNEISKKIYKSLNCNGIVRMDYILKNDIFYFLEVNSIPGMTSASIIPKMIKSGNINITKLFTSLIDSAINSKKK